MATPARNTTTKRSRTSRPVARSKKKQQKYKILWGRVFLALSPLFVVIAMVLVSRFGGNLGANRGGGDFRRPIAEAINAGRADAEKVMQTPAGSMERDAALLHIHAKESALRANGFPHAADDYIGAATEYLLTNGIL